MDVPAHPDALLLHRLVEAAAGRHPEKIALVCGSRSVTYGELDRRANQVARILPRFGAAPDARIAILMDRSIAHAVAALAVLKSGAAFVPIDPEWPAERIETVIEDSGAIACLARDAAIASTRIPTLRVDDDGAQDAPESGIPARPAPARVSTFPRHLAYVIHTSGSTGRPKGVMIEHGAIARHLAAITEVYRLTSADRSLLFHSIAFDPSIEQLFGPLVRGGQVVMREGAPWSAAAFADFVRDREVTVATLPAAYWLQLLREWDTAGGAPPLGPLRQVIVGGEALPPAAVALWRKLGLTRIRFLNDYGPTEATVTATVHDIPAHAAPNEACGRIPIGRPHACVEAIILAPDGLPAPAGETGELCLAGPTLARGYLGREDLTREKFAALPGDPTAPVYRTGDLARLHPDGTLDFLGRIDDQVKVRGHRIELGEVENALSRIAGIGHAAVVVIDKGDGDKHLAAFLVTPEAAPLDVAELRRELARRLPAPAIPAEFHFCIQLPVAPNGKVDRAALAARPDARQSRAPLPSRDDGRAIEDIVADAWLERLGLAQLDRAANVFEHGATSITVARVHRALETALDRAFSVTLLFERTSIRSLAEALSNPPRAAMTGAIARAREQRAALARRRPTTRR